MKRFLFALFLPVIAAPVFATDVDADRAAIPSYEELVREGYGPHHNRGDHEVLSVIEAAPEPTQAYYTKGQTFYYGFKAIPVHLRYGESKVIYAFGYPLSFYREMMPSSITNLNLERCVVAVSNQTHDYKRLENTQQSQTNHGSAITTIQSTAPATVTASVTTPQPSTGEKPAH